MLLFFPKLHATDTRIEPSYQQVLPTSPITKSALLVGTRPTQNMIFCGILSENPLSLDLNARPQRGRGPRAGVVLSSGGTLRVKGEGNFTQLSFPPTCS